MKKVNNKKLMNELVSMVIYTRNVDKANGFKRSIGIIDKDQLDYEKNLEVTECLKE